MKYIGLTIGPIVKTMLNTKKTRALWSASYIFSYMMREIIAEFAERDFVTPYIPPADESRDRNGAGLYHDRAIFVAKNGDYGMLEKRIETVVSNIAGMVSKKLDKNAGQMEVKEFLQNYFQINYLEVETEGNPILKLSPMLDALELQTQIKQYERNYLLEFLENVNGSFLMEDAFGQRKKSFDSLAQIASRELAEKLADEQKSVIFSQAKEENIYKSLENEFGKALKPIHRYIAIVQADGDGIGKVIESLQQEKEDTAPFREFSKKLFDFASASVKEIAEYGGAPIYAGGDDLLFFAPVVSGNENLFDLLEKLSTLFEESFKEHTKPPTLSFGVSISYYKFPLYEAKAEAAKRLFDIAKTLEKNNIALKVQKHSGQSFATLLHKESPSYKLFIQMLTTLGAQTAENDLLLHAIHHKLANNKATLQEIAVSQEKLENYFCNYFNEEVHKEKRPFLSQIAELLYHLREEQPKSFMDEATALLRMIKFIKGEKE